MDEKLSVYIRFKTKRQADEFIQVNNKIQAMIFLIAYLMEKLWGYEPTVTSIKRTREEQEALRKAGKTKLSDSPHMHWRALDIRLNDFPSKRHIGTITGIINSEFPRRDGKPTALVHGTGANYHLHLQVPT